MDFKEDDNIDYILNKIASSVIREKRISKGYSLEDVAKRIGGITTRQTLSRYENNDTRMKNGMFQKICIALGENPADVWNEINEKLVNTISFDNATPVDINSNTVLIPVLGTIKAGIAIEAQQDIIEYIDIPKSWLRGGKSFYGLLISGDSMEPKYSEKDIVIFEQNSDKEKANNKECAVMVNGYDATFKYVNIDNNGITLIPLNINNADGYKPTYYNKEQIEELPVRIIGIAKEKRTRL